MSNIRVRWVEPNSNEINWIEKSCTIEEAIALQVQAASKRGYKYETLEDALDDFLVINWAVLK